MCLLYASTKWNKIVYISIDGAVQKLVIGVLGFNNCCYIVWWRQQKRNCHYIFLSNWNHLHWWINLTFLCLQLYNIIGYLFQNSKWTWKSVCYFSLYAGTLAFVDLFSCMSERFWFPTMHLAPVYHFTASSKSVGRFVFGLVTWKLKVWD